MDQKTAIGAAGSFLSLHPPLDRVQAYLQHVEETREVMARLRLVLRSLDSYKQALTASKASGDDLRSKVDRLSLPVRIPEIEELLRAMMEFIDDFSGVIVGVLGFAKASHELVSYEEDFMQKVHRTLPEIYDIIRFFGMNYEPKTSALDLSHLPTFFAVHVVEVQVPEEEIQRETQDLSKQVTEGGASVDKAIKVARSIGQQNLRIRDRHLKREFPRSFKGLFKEIEKLKATTEVATELSKNSPPWLLEFAKIMERVQVWLEEQSKPIYRSEKPGFKTTAHRK